MAVGVFLGLVGCAGRPSLPELDTVEGRLYKEKCGHCHKPHHPRLYDSVRWAYVVDHMADRQMVLLKPGEQDAILKYLRRHSRF